MLLRSAGSSWAAMDMDVPERVCTLVGVSMDEVMKQMKNLKIEHRPEDDIPALDLGVSALLTQSRTHRCPECGCRQQESFKSDEKSGDTVCTVCGVVVVSNEMHCGEWARRFEGDEEDMTQHGAAFDPCMSQSMNLSTHIGAKRFRKVHRQVELRADQCGLAKRGTRTAYRDMHKQSAFRVIRDVGTHVHLPHRVLDCARQYFATHRDRVEAIRSFDVVVAACLVKAYEADTAAGARCASSDTNGSDGASTALAFTCPGCRRTFGKKHDLAWHACADKQRSVSAVVLETSPTSSSIMKFVALRRSRSRDMGRARANSMSMVVGDRAPDPALPVVSPRLSKRAALHALTPENQDLYGDGADDDVLAALAQKLLEVNEVEAGKCDDVAAAGSELEWSRSLPQAEDVETGAAADESEAVYDMPCCFDSPS